MGSGKARLRVTNVIRAGPLARSTTAGTDLAHRPPRVLRERREVQRIGQSTCNGYGPGRASASTWCSRVACGHSMFEGAITREGPRSPSDMFGRSPVPGSTMATLSSGRARGRTQAGIVASSVPERRPSEECIIDRRMLSGPERRLTAADRPFRSAVRPSPAALAGSVSVNRAPPSSPGGHRDRAVVAGHDLGHDGQPQTGAARGPGPGRVQPGEALEHPLPLLGGDARAVVVDLQDHRPAPLDQADRHPACGRDARRSPAGSAPPCAAVHHRRAPDRRTPHWCR